MKRIVFLERNSFPPGVPIRRPGFPHEWVEFGETRPDRAADRLRGAHVAVTNKCRIDASVFAAASTLELVAVSATGTDCVDKGGRADGRRAGHQCHGLCRGQRCGTRARASPRARARRARL